MPKQMKLIIFIMALAATAAPSSQTTGHPSWHGGVSIVNNLDATLNLWSVSVEDGPHHDLTPSGGCYHEVWRPTVNGTGVSIKIAASDNLTDVIQFEYSAVYPVIYWDVSCIDLVSDSRIIHGGFTAISSDMGCKPVLCAAGDDNCPDVYHEPDDNHAVRGCSINASVVLQLGFK
jgi:hypothetical protein